MLLTALLSSKAAAAAVGAVVVAGSAAAAVTLPAALGHAGTRPVATSSADDTESDEATAPSSEESTETEVADDPTTETEVADDPTAEDEPTATPSATGPDATGPAAFGLCTAWAHGGLTYAKAEQGNPAAKALVDAAGDGTVEDYCTAVLLEKKGTPEPADSETATAADDSSEPGAEGRSTGASAKAQHGKSDHRGAKSGADKARGAGSRP